MIGQLAFVDYHENGRIFSVALDHLEPVVKVALVLVFTGIEHKQVQAALGKEELVRGMHNLLAAEVPDVEPNFLLCRLMLSRITPLDNIDPLSSLFFWVVFI